MAAKSTNKPSSSTTKGRAKGKAARRKKTNWADYKLFDQPEFRLPFRLAKFEGYGKARRGVSSGEPWLRAALASGLVEMGLPPGVEPEAGFLSPIDPRKRMKKIDLKKVLAEGMKKTIQDLEKL